MELPIAGNGRKEDPLKPTEDTDAPGSGSDSVLRPPAEVSGSGPFELSRPETWLPVLVGFGIPFLLVFTLAVEAGGYEAIFRSQVGIIVWWTVLLGLTAGLLPSLRVTRPGWFALCVFGGLVAITALATLTWTESAERSVIELSRTLTIFGIFLLLLLVQGRDGLRRTLAAVGAATALVAIIALVDRFDPGLLPFGASQLLPENYPRARLNFPLEYWNGLAAMMAIGLAPLVWLAGSARDAISRSLAAGAVPLVLLATYMTASRGGSAAALLALVALVVLFPERIRLVLTSIVPALGSVFLIVMVNGRPGVRDLVPGDTSASQGIEMLWICVAVAIVVAGLQYLVTERLESGRIRVPAVEPRKTRMVGIAAGGLVVLALLVGLFSGFLSEQWDGFKQPVEESTVSRLSTVNSSERYLVWDSSFDAAASEKLTGIGPGAFEYWWAREGNGEQFVRDAHSLYFEALAEMGPLAFLLVMLLVFGPIAWCVRLSIQPGRERFRAPLAAAAGGMVAFAIAAGVDWAWELTVLPVAFFALVAAVLGPEVVASGRSSARASGSGPAEPEPTAGQSLKPAYRIVAGLGSLVAIVVIAVPMLGTQAYESSQQLVRQGDLDGALSKAERSAELQPWAASPLIQEVQVLELLGRHREAAEVARDAIDREEGNWRNWLVYSQVLGQFSPAESAAALDRARALNSKSTLPELRVRASDGR